jgi:hypothetical protein
MLKKIGLFMGLLAVSSISWGQTPNVEQKTVPSVGKLEPRKEEPKLDEPEQPNFGVVEVHASEAIRRGNSLVVAGEGPRGATQDAVISATAPPPDDNHMWFISVFKQKGCPPCDQLISDFRTSDFLKAFIEAPEPHKAWAHFNVYDIHDETQKDRLKRYFVHGTPTIVIQPPRNDSWGPAKTVVAQYTGYDGNPKKLAERFTKDVRAYAAKMAAEGYPRPAPYRASAEGAEADEDEPEAPSDPTAGATQAPFTVPTADPFTPRPPQPLNFPPDMQQQVAATPQQGGILERLFSNGSGMQILLLFALVALRAWEMRAKTTPGSLDDQIATYLRELVENMRSGGGSSQETVVQTIRRRAATRRRPPAGPSSGTV